MESSVLLTAGVVCLIAAIVGGGLKAFGIQLPVLDSVRRQILLGILGLGLIAMTQLNREQPSTASANTQNRTSSDRVIANASLEDGAGNQPGTAPAPPTAEDATSTEQGLRTARGSYNALLTSVDNLVANGLIRPGSPKAIRIAAAAERANNGLDAATTAVREGNRQSYAHALGQADVALAELSSELAMSGNR